MRVKKDKGFTIIEVVLVLAIAGLIFMVVFLALPALQRQQRDNQRRSDIGRVIAAVQSYQGNNNGKAPNDLDSVKNNESDSVLVKNYLKNSSAFNDPSGSPYVFKKADTLAAAKSNSRNNASDSSENNGATWKTGNIYYVVGQACDGKSRKGVLTFVSGLESGGEYCQSN